MGNKDNEGSYLGTEVGQKWWRRYLKDGMFMRGMGEYWYDEKGFYFLKVLAKKPMFIPWDLVKEIKLGKWHSGRLVLLGLVLKLVWEKDGKTLSSGFVLSDNKERSKQIAAEFSSMISKVG